MTATDWIKDKLTTQGRDWLHNNFNAFCLEVPLGEGKVTHNPDTYMRLIRKAVAENSNIPAEDRPTTVEEGLDFHQVDMTKLDIQSVTVNTWGSPTNPNKQVKVKLQPKADLFDVDELIKDFKEAIATHKVTSYTPKQRQVTNKALYEINIADAHLGLLAWAQEAGEDYDINIARDVYLDCVHYLLERVPQGISQILLVAGNDFFNSDTIENTTTKGTRQSEDGRFQKTFKIGWQTLVTAIDMCREVADVDVMIVGANHDFQRSYFLGEVLTAWYKEDKHVTIDNRPVYYKYYHFGKNLLGFSHGDGCKSENLPMLMANDVPGLWGQTLYREFHTGHMHTSVTKMYGSEVEKIGCKVVSVPSLAAQSDWIAKNGFRSVREALAFIYDYDYGRLGTVSYRPNFKAL